MPRKTKEQLENNVLTHVMLLTDKAPAVISLPINWRTFEWDFDAPLHPIMTLAEIQEHERGVVKLDGKVNSSTILSPRFLSGLRLIPSTRKSVLEQSTDTVATYIPEEHELLLFSFQQVDEPVMNVCRCFFMSYSAVRDWSSVYAFDRVAGKFEKVGTVRTRLLLDRYSGMELVSLPRDLQRTMRELHDMPKHMHGVMDEVVTPAVSLSPKEREELAQFVRWDNELGALINKTERERMGRVYSGAANVDPEGWKKGHPTPETLERIAKWTSGCKAINTNHAKTKNHLDRCLMCNRILMELSMPYFHTDHTGKIPVGVGQ